MSATFVGFATIFIIGEVFAFLIFEFLRRRFDVFKHEANLFSTDKDRPGRSPGTEVLKGVLERLVVTFGLFIDLAGILTVFAALKLANRLTHEGDHSDQSKNYFLIGNLLTILFCLVYYKLALEFADPLGQDLIETIKGAQTP